MPPLVNFHLIGCKWVFRVKRKTNGTIDKFKAWLIAEGYQRLGLDYTETFSLVVKPTTIQIILVIVAMNSWPLRQMDVNNTFLNGALIEAVYISYISQLQGFKDASKPNHA